MARLLLLSLLALVLIMAEAKPVVKTWKDLRCLFHVGTCYRRTVIAVRRITSYDEYVFIRGGSFGSGDPIPIKHRLHPEKGGSYYGAMSVNDRQLSWEPTEVGQGHYHGEPAQGTPLLWTTNVLNYRSTAAHDGVGFHPLNRMGPHYWLVDLDMDCSKLGEDGLFEFKGFMVNRRWNWQYWEVSNNYRKKCGKDEVRSHQGNHVGQCGKMNVVHFNGYGCDVVQDVPE